MAKVKAFGKPHMYVLEDERRLPRDKQTVWWYRIADLETQLALNEVLEFEGDLNDNSNLKTLYRPDRRGEAELIKNCLIRVENLHNEDGHAIEWPQDGQRQDDFLAVLPPVWRSELASAFRCGEDVK